MKETSVENQLAAFPLLARSHAAGWELFVAAHGNISYHKAWTYPSRVCVPTSACLCTCVQVCTLTASASFSPDIYAHVAERTEPGCAQVCTGSGHKYRLRGEVQPGCVERVFLKDRDTGGPRRLRDLHQSLPEQEVALKGLESRPLPAWTIPQPYGYVVLVASFTSNFSYVFSPILQTFFFFSNYRKQSSSAC